MANATMCQFFHWYYPTDRALWRDAASQAERLASLGVTAVWLPPASKGADGAKTIGYDIYDLYDLGEFDQKGSVQTRYGTKEEFLKAIEAFHDHGIQVYADVVLNHKAGADESEEVTAHRVNPDNRREIISDPYLIRAFTRFTFPGRGDRYSDFKWDFHCFSGVDWDDRAGEKGVFKIHNEYGEDWEELLGDEKGNFDYLMFADVDFRNPAVREELSHWGAWFVNETGADGFRLDAAKHITPSFFPEWLTVLREKTGKELFTVAEFAAGIDLIHAYIERTQRKYSLFDFPLHRNFRTASTGRGRYDLRKIFDGTLTGSDPELSVTFVDNHDTQPYREFASDIKNWFKPHAYALILLREAGYPCVFHPDLYGASYSVKRENGKTRKAQYKICPALENLLRARKDHAYGAQRDYFSGPNLIGWVREGSGEGMISGCAVVLSTAAEAALEMDMGAYHGGKTFYDITGSRDDKVTTDENGKAAFPVNAKGVSVWVREG
jgi:alpha-amylase